VAGLNPQAVAERLRPWLGRIIAIAAMVLAVLLGREVLQRIDQRPSTHDAFLYADTAALAPDVSGRIVALHVRDQQRVTKGEKLLVIDPEPFQWRVNQAKAQVDALHAQIGLTKRQVAAQSSGAEAAATMIARARTQLALAHDSVKRLLPLQGKGYVTDQKVDEARSNEKTAQDALAEAVLQARQAKEAVGDTEALLAQLNGAQAALALAERDLRNTTLKAPFDGLVAGLAIAEGTFAAAGHPLFTLIKARPWYAVGNFRETDLPRIAAGDPATVWLMADTTHPIKGHVESIGWGVRTEDSGAPGLPAVGRTLSWVVVAQRFPVRIRLDDPPEAVMRMGATVSVFVDHGHGRDR
jgi:multidrug efflux system membrane fusion protein